jgi:hypothetical protein
MLHTYINYIDFIYIIYQIHSDFLRHTLVKILNPPPLAPGRVCSSVVVIVHAEPQLKWPPPISSLPRQAMSRAALDGGRARDDKSYERDFLCCSCARRTGFVFLCGIPVLIPIK